jgi:hypothetical protein
LSLVLRSWVQSIVDRDLNPGTNAVGVSRVLQDSVLRKTFGPTRKEVTGNWIKLQNDELHAVYSSPNIIRVPKTRTMRWADRTCGMYGRQRKCIQSFGRETSTNYTAWKIHAQGKLSLSTARRHIIGGTEVQLHSLLTSDLGGEWLTARPGRFTPGKEPRYPFNSTLVGLDVECGR